MSKKTSSKKSAPKSAPKKTTAPAVAGLAAVAPRPLKTRSEMIADAVARKAEQAETGSKTGRFSSEPSVANTPKPTSKKELKRGPRAESASARAEAMIRDGRTDEEVMDALVKHHGVDPVSKKHYPSWYRARLVRNGAITKAFADQHRHAPEKG